jgi:hypothetical protein
LLHFWDSGSVRRARDIRTRNQPVPTTHGALRLEDHSSLLLIPATGPDLGALTSAGLPDSLVARVRETAAGWRRGQYLVQVHDEALMPRALAEDAVRIQQQFVISGQGSVWVVSMLKKSDAKAVPPDRHCRGPLLRRGEGQSMQNVVHRVPRSMTSSGPSGGAPRLWRRKIRKVILMVYAYIILS